MKIALISIVIVLACVVQSKPVPQPRSRHTDEPSDSAGLEFAEKDKGRHKHRKSSHSKGDEGTLKPRKRKHSKNKKDRSSDVDGEDGHKKKSKHHRHEEKDKHHKDGKRKGDKHEHHKKRKGASSDRSIQGHDHTKDGSRFYGLNKDKKHDKENKAGHKHNEGLHSQAQTQTGSVDPPKVGGPLMAPPPSSVVVGPPLATVEKVAPVAAASASNVLPLLQ